MVLLRRTILTLTLLALADAAVAATNHAPPPPPCSPQKVCDFVKQLSRAKVEGHEHLSLLCTPEEHCTISGMRLGGELVGVVATVIMENVLIENNRGPLFPIGLMFIDRTGNVTGTNLTFRNGRANAAV